MGAGKFNAGVTLRWTGISSKGKHHHLMPKKPELSAGLMGHKARMQTLPFTSTYMHYIVKVEEQKLDLNSLLVSNYLDCWKMN